MDLAFCGGICRKSQKSLTKFQPKDHSNVRLQQLINSLALLDISFVDNTRINYKLRWDAVLD
jgi:hypothetical protein